MLLLIAGIMLSGAGCASDNGSQAAKAASPPPAPTGSSQPQPDPLPAGVTFTKDKDLQNVWLAPGFDFKGYDAVYVGDTAFKAVERPNEVDERKMAVLHVKVLEVEALNNSQLFKVVTSDTNEIPAGSRTLRLQNTIVEFEKGGGGARYWAGLFGAGQPVTKVRGLLYDGDRLVFAYEAKRSGDSAGSRLAGGWLSDRAIQSDDIRDLAFDLAGFMERTAGVQPTQK